MQLRLALVALLAAGASALVAPSLAARPLPVARAATDAMVMGAARSVGRLPAKKAVAKRAAPKKVAPKKVVKKAGILLEVSKSRGAQLPLADPLVSAVLLDDDGMLFKYCQPSTPSHDPRA